MDDIAEANSDNSCVMITAGKSEELNFVNSDMVLLKGKKRHESPAVLFIDDSGKTEDEKI